MNSCLPVALGVLVGLLRLPALLRNPRDPLLRSVGALLLTAVGVFVFAAVPMIAKVNEVTGVPNFAAPLVYSLLTACAGSGLVLVINWRGGRPGHIRRAKRWCIGAYCAVCAALFALFALGSAPVERLRDFDTYYSGSAYLREMIVLYLLVHTVSALLMSFLCWRWLREVTGELRVGLALIVVGYSLSVCFDVCKFTAIGARWAGLDWDYLSTDLARPFGTASAPFIAFGFGLPLVVQRFRGPWREWVHYRQLGPLSRLVGGLSDGAPAVSVPLLAPVGVRRLQRESAIHDGLLTLNPYFDLGLRARVHAAALAAAGQAGSGSGSGSGGGRGAGGEGAAALADAAMIVAAVEALHADPERRVIAESRVLQEGTSEHHELVRISRSLPTARPPRPRWKTLPKARTHPVTRPLPAEREHA
ncbi:MAB_1171c family putative transporter [Streptomyces sp. NPDC048507]|uniref:MAB_1171c family putative transporter n=1 Tax=Streptomyces sp. NPDC048507 TaxID=3365560 RepID=UPI003712727C